MSVEGPLERLLQTDRETSEQEFQAVSASENLKAEALKGAETRRTDRLAQEKTSLETAFSRDKTALEAGLTRALNEYGSQLEDQEKDPAGFEKTIRGFLTGGG